MSNDLDIFELTDRAKRAQRALATSTTAQRNGILLAISHALVDHCEQILHANAQDCQRAEERGMAAGLVDRLRLDEFAAAVQTMVFVLLSFEFPWVSLG